MVEIVVKEGESIRDAVDRAKPGDVVRVLPGVHTVDSATARLIDLRNRQGVRLIGVELEKGEA